MPYIPDGLDVEVRRAELMTRKDHRQRWVYSGPNGASITDTPIPHKDKVAVYWLPVQQCTACTYSPRTLAHCAISATHW